MGVIGIDPQSFNDAPTPDGFIQLEPGLGVPFVITDIREGVAKKGKREGKEYVMIGCLHTRDDGKKVYSWEYFTLDSNDPEGLGWLKKFVCAIGRGDVLAKPSNTWDMLIDTEFKADVFRDKNQKSKIDYNKVTPLTHKFTTIPGSEKSAAAPGPRRPGSVRGGAQR